MNTVTYETYENDKAEFFKAHDFDYTLHTSDSVNGCYHKEYAFDDGAVFYESMSKVTEEHVIEAHGIKSTATVVYMRTEYWTTDNAKTKTLFENW